LIVFIILPLVLGLFSLVNHLYFYYHDSKFTWIDMMVKDIGIKVRKGNQFLHPLCGIGWESKFGGKGASFLQSKENCSIACLRGL